MPIYTGYFTGVTSRTPAVWQPVPSGALNTNIETSNTLYDEIKNYLEELDLVGLSFSPGGTEVIESISVSLTYVQDIDGHSKPVVALSTDGGSTYPYTGTGATSDGMTWTFDDGMWGIPAGTTWGSISFAATHWLVSATDTPFPPEALDLNVLSITVTTSNVGAAIPVLGSQVVHLPGVGIGSPRSVRRV